MSRLKKHPNWSDKVSKKKLSAIFRSTATGKGYKIAIKKTEEILKNNPHLEDEQRLCDLALLYDHQAALEENIDARKKYEKKAFELCRRVLSINPGSIYDAYAMWGIGRIWWHRKNKKALKYAKKAASLMKEKTGETGGMIVNIGLVYDTLGNYHRAEYWLLKALCEDPKQLGLHYNLARFYHKHNRMNKLKRCLPTLKKLFNEKDENYKKSDWGKFLNIQIKRIDKASIIDKSKKNSDQIA